MNFQIFNEKCKIIINDSQNKAISLNHQQVTPEHLIISIINDNDSYIKEIFDDCNIDILNLIKDLERRISSLPSILGSNLNILF